MFQPLLSICIPTYNRAELLSYALNQMIKETANFQDKLEIVISDNHSTDDTENVVSKFKESCSILRYYKNNENIGFNFNIFRIIDQYAKGKYCWIIGDDDFIYDNSISKLISVLQDSEDVDFLYTNFDLKEIETIRAVFSNNKNLSRPINADNPTGYICSFDEILSKEYRPNNLLLTYISSTIFRTDLLKKTNKTLINKESLSNFQSLFPHSYFYSYLMKGRISYFFESPLVVATVHEKSWDDKLPILHLKFLPELFDFYIKNNYSSAILEKTYESIIKSAIPFLFRRIVKTSYASHVKINFAHKYFTSIYFYKVLFMIMLRKFKSLIY